MSNRSLTVAAPKKGRLIKLFLGLSISAVCIYLIFKKIDIQDVVSVLAEARWEVAAIALLFLAIDYFFRIVRWRVLLNVSADKALSTSACWSPFMGSIMLNNVLPFRAGDIVRSIVFPNSMGISRILATSSVLLERLIDLLTLFVLLSISIILLSGSAIPDYVKFWSPIMAVGSIGGLLCIMFCGKILSIPIFQKLLSSIKETAAPQGGIKALLFDFSNSLNRMTEYRITFKNLTLSFLIWVCEAIFFLFIIKAFGVEVTLVHAIFVMAFSTLSTLIPSSPGYFGTFHLVAIFALEAVGVSVATAGGIAVALHLFLWGSTSLVGAVAILGNPRLMATNL